MKTLLVLALFISNAAPADPGAGATATKMLVKKNDGSYAFAKGDDSGNLMCVQPPAATTASVGPDAPGVAPTKNPVQTACVDADGNVRRNVCDNTGALNTNSSARSGAATTEVLVLTTPTAVPAVPLVGRKSIEIQNLGPNPIFCTLDGSVPVVDKARQIEPDAAWPVDCSDTACIVQCVSKTANQVTLNATIVTELK